MPKIALMELIYEDFVNSIASVRAGADPEAAFLSHEKRVAPLRKMVSALSKGSERPLSAKPKLTLVTAAAAAFQAAPQSD